MLLRFTSKIGYRLSPCRSDWSRTFYGLFVIAVCLCIE